MMKKVLKLIAIFIILCSSGFVCAGNAPRTLVDKLQYDGYLFAYFEGRHGDSRRHEQIRFAVSADGINWKALNHNEPILILIKYPRLVVSEILIFCAEKMRKRSIWWLQICLLLRMDGGTIRELLC